MSLLERIKQGTTSIITEEELNQKLSRGNQLKIKFGIDPTSPDLHLGHLVVLRKLKLFQEHGHKIILIIGDFTAKIGDPSGRDDTRPILSDEEIKKNAETYKEQIFRILDENNIEIVYNSEWLFKVFNIKDMTDLNYMFQIFFARYTIQQLLQREEFSKRQTEGKPISLLEVIYPLFQAYDSVVIDADVEIGGNDQLFNLLFARQMQKDFGKEPQVIITLPLLPGTDGVRKMSKTYNNHIAFNDTPDNIYGKIMSISDELMYVYYELLTNYNLEQIKQLHPMVAKKKIAFELTELLYTKELAQKAQGEFERVFSKRMLPSEIPTYRTSVRKWKLSDLLYTTGLAESKKEARRLIKYRAVEINNEIIYDDKEINLSDETILKVGKKKFLKVSIST